MNEAFKCLDLRLVYSVRKFKFSLKIVWLFEINSYNWLTNLYVVMATL